MAGPTESETKTLTIEEFRAFLDKQRLISQQDAAEYFGVGQATISRWLSGTRPIPKWLSMLSSRLK